MIEIIPAIIPKNFSDLTEKLSLVKGLVSLVQIDISDGKFTSNKTWPNVLNPDPDLVKIIREEEGFPFWDELDFEIHLMVTDPEAEIQKWISAGAKRIIVHYESFSGPEKVLSFAQGFQDQFGGSGSYIATELGVALNLETDNEVLEILTPYTNFAQLMGIARDGYQGAPFDEAVIPKIRALHSMFPDLLISVDGGISMQNAPVLVEAGASRLVIGHAIFQSDDIPGTIEEFKNI